MVNSNIVTFKNIYRYRYFINMLISMLKNERFVHAVEELESTLELNKTKG